MPLGEVDHLADPIGREVRPDRVAGGIEQARDLGQVLGLGQLLAQGEQDLLLAPRPVEVVVADALARADVGERRPAVEVVLAGAQLEAVAARRASRSAGR